MPDHKMLLTAGFGGLRRWFRLYKRVSNTLAGHPTKSKTVYRQRRANSLFCCTLAEHFVLDEKFTTALSIFVFSKVAEVGL